ncbi:hypothetical protein DFO66_103387 [Brevibacterium sanguinis]|uniref:Uncharacterized protein n=2 Tax=Brevibacterium TaxID=1696 RepID=A0A366IP21_9MICO|nr:MULTISPECIES: hypothetical protein [Brevibacterium]RBP66437.1 hypothetical protein DFO66_103387 [Brevibacterium sanguinis]RBP73089.1 hypothetical protein DFO65_103387 [Brevibacterium celere]
MATMAELKNGAHNASLIRKILNSVSFIAPLTTTLPETYFTTGGALAAAPVGFLPMGIVGKDDGYNFAADQDSEEVEGHGYTSPVRIDITSAQRTMQATFLETRKETLEQALGVDLSGITPGANGEIEFIEPELPVQKHVRMVNIGSDGAGDQEWFLIKEYPYCKVTEIGDMSWSASDALQYELTYTAFPDPVLGYSVRNFIGGPGAIKALEDMGFPAYTPTP